MPSASRYRQSFPSMQPPETSVPAGLKSQCSVRPGTLRGPRSRAHTRGLALGGPSYTHWPSRSAGHVPGSRVPHILPFQARLRGWVPGTHRGEAQGCNVHVPDSQAQPQKPRAAGEFSLLADRQRPEHRCPRASPGGLCLLGEGDQGHYPADARSLYAQRVSRLPFSRPCFSSSLVGSPGSCLHPEPNGNRSTPAHGRRATGPHGGPGSHTAFGAASEEGVTCDRSPVSSGEGAAGRATRKGAALLPAPGPILGSGSLGCPSPTVH